MRASWLAVGPLVLVTAHCTTLEDVESNEAAPRVQRQALEAPKFLAEDGLGSDQEARAYYQLLGPQYVPGTYTLGTWVADNIGSSPAYEGFYRNRNELGFWREMKCTQYVGRALGGCMVRNWATPDDPSLGRPNLGTVAMNVSAAGATQFFVFAPSGKLSTSAVLDSEGEKFVPNVCTSCHSGAVPVAQSDLSAVFREFEPSELEQAPRRANTGLEWFQLNQSVRSANQSLRTEGEGAAFGIDHARRAQGKYVRSIYPLSTTASLSVRDASHLPPSWAARVGDPPRLTSAKKRLWTQLVAPYCMTCHRTNSADWAEYDQFLPLGSLSRGQTRLETYLEKPATHRAGFPYMPNAQLLYETMKADSSVEPAIREWVTAIGDPSCQIGTVCVPREECRAGEIRSCDDTRNLCVPLAPLPDGSACGDGRSCSQGRCAESISFSIPIIVAGVYVRSERPNSPEQHLRIVANRDLFVTQISDRQLCYLPATERVFRCNVATLTCTEGVSGDAFIAPRTGEGATLDRVEPAQRTGGRYRLESPIDLPPCP